MIFVISTLEGMHVLNSLVLIHDCPDGILATFVTYLIHLMDFKRLFLSEAIFSYCSSDLYF